MSSLFLYFLMSMSVGFIAAVIFFISIIGLFSSIGTYIYDNDEDLLPGKPHDTDDLYKIAPYKEEPKDDIG